MDPVPLATMSVAWHMVTLQLIVTTVALAYLVRHTNPVVWGGRLCHVAGVSHVVHRLWA